MMKRMKPIRLLSTLFILGGAIGLINCANPLMSSINQRSEKANTGTNPFTSFSFRSTLNSAAGITIDCVGQLTGTDTAVTVPSGANVTALKATFTTAAPGTVTIGSTVQTSEQTANDFTSPVKYTFTSADGTIYNGTVTVTVAPSGVMLGVTSLTLAVGNASVYLYASVTPSNANTDLTWSSSAPGIAKVSSSGTPLSELVTPVAVGTATITATTADGSKSATCSVTVTKAVPVTSVSVSPSTLNLSAGGDVSYTDAYILPTNASNQQVTWSSSDPTVATLSANSWGTYADIVPVAAGTATITVTTADGQKTATCTVNVTAPIAVTGVMISSSSMSLTAGDGNDEIDTRILPSNATNQNVTWSTSDATVVSIVGGALSYTYISGLKAGTATITATTVDGGFTAICKVTVIAVTGITVSPSTLSLNVSGTPNPTSNYLSLSATPSGAYPDATWSSSNTAVAIVGYYGTVTAISPGTATITATFGSFTATCAVTVSP